MTIRPSAAPAFLLTRSQKEELEDIYHGLIVTVEAARKVDESGFPSVVVELLGQRSEILDQLTSYRMLPVGEEVVKKALESQEIPEILRERFAEELSKSRSESEGGAQHE